GVSLDALTVGASSAAMAGTGVVLALLPLAVRPTRRALAEQYARFILLVRPTKRIQGFEIVCGNGADGKAANSDT
ncbi:MAG TPA: hypothetical protein VK324_06335, partial [Tepidisphaeraceae bacterium]|nr:hypothetical protein [Tepidisphaeraceae bacterium]